MLDTRSGTSQLVVWSMSVICSSTSSIWADWAAVRMARLERCLDFLLDFRFLLLSSKDTKTSDEDGAEAAEEEDFVVRFVVVVVDASPSSSLAHSANSGDIVASSPPPRLLLFLFDFDDEVAASVGMVLSAR